jgi:hypothetical protein
VPSWAQCGRCASEENYAKRRGNVPQPTHDDEAVMDGAPTSPHSPLVFPAKSGAIKT